jgi:hypothetical protein
VNRLLRHAADMQNTIMLQEAKNGLLALKVRTACPNLLKHRQN